MSPGAGANEAEGGGAGESGPNRINSPSPDDPMAEPKSSVRPYPLAPNAPIAPLTEPVNVDAETDTAALVPPQVARVIQVPLFIFTSGNIEVTFSQGTEARGGHHKHTQTHTQTHRPAGARNREILKLLKSGVRAFILIQGPSKGQNRPKYEENRHLGP